MPRITLRGDILNSVYRPHLENPRRYQLYFGGAGSGKSVFLATRCVLDAFTSTSPPVATATMHSVTMQMTAALSASSNKTPMLRRWDSVVDGACGVMK